MTAVEREAIRLRLEEAHVIIGECVQALYADEERDAAKAQAEKSEEE